MKIGYLLNTYPAISGTFIRREIHAMEALGVSVERYAVRRWEDELVDPRDRAERDRANYLLSGGKGALIRGFLTELASNPGGILRALGPWVRLVRHAGGDIVRHAAYLVEAALLRRWTLRDGIEHIHCHYSTNPAAVAMLCHAMGGPGFSFTAHGPDELVDPAATSLGLKIERASFAVAITSFCRTVLALAGGMAAWDRLHVVHCGLDLSEFPVSEAPFEDNATLVCVGRLCPQKAQVLIPGAVAEIVRDHPDIRVVLVGDGESRGAIEDEIRRLGLEDRIELAGWASNAEVRARIGSARALLLPSFAEGLPIVLMEALALGRPVITTYIAGIPELVDEGCGWLVPAGSHDDLVAAIDAAMRATPETLAAMGQEGRRRIEARHDQHVSAAQLRDLFAGAITRASP
ncbi:MAG: glycosyltransferase family 4 protein [Pseudomonadota bacterium]